MKVFCEAPSHHYLLASLCLQAGPRQKLQQTVHWLYLDSISLELERTTNTSMDSDSSRNLPAFCSFLIANFSLQSMGGSTQRLKGCSRFFYRMFYNVVNLFLLRKHQGWRMNVVQRGTLNNKRLI
ncbi:hypothetical protein FRX31_018300 [Thalictrum thalictroides]|uniref:Uncharacterized protein n=1 Tax=Thalictrum thalictroides TaxID=46969 RepID=A0A7J6W4W1_THATH|nr:hypothetical protein FRX31_018300 [Thalictrum thalictroides]